MPTKNITIHSEDGEENIIAAPAYWSICEECSGEGRALRPSLRNVVIDPNEWSPEELEGYYRGDYDTTCSPCKGTGKVLRVEEERFKERDPESHAAWARHCEEERQYQQEVEAEARWEHRMLYGTDG